ncbi:MAG: transcription antitermination factor NusB [Treponema sp.]|nr:transcription antitermination factor NusB [Treponema bryantii]MBO5825877.1 transcription antitermination factor NusB [Treponema sp.]MBQ7970121.1 transcription antitermination factor NusB [Treponema sp.]
MSRRKSRIIAFQALYSWNVSRVPTEELLTFSWLKKDSEFTPNELEEQTFASFIISGTIDHLDEIDNLISSHLSSSWTMERINKVSLAILRTSTYEIKFQAGSNPKIVIDEAVNIAKEYGSDDSYKFINAILDKIEKDEGKTLS